MDLDRYQELASRTRNHSIDQDTERCNYAMGLCGESGEVVELVKKHIFHGHDAMDTRKAILDECGDVLWYLSQLLDVYGISLEAAATCNIEKLQRRYPEGFSKDDSRFRN